METVTCISKNCVSIDRLKHFNPVARPYIFPYLMQQCIKLSLSAHISIEQQDDLYLSSFCVWP